MMRRLLTLLALSLALLLLCSGTLADAPNAPPQPPGWVAATDGATDYIQVFWAECSNTTSYKVYRSDMLAGTKQYKTTTAAGFRQYNDHDAANGTTYWYWVQACNGDGCSDYGGPDTGYRLDPPPAPTGVSASDGTVVGQVRITWNASSGATSYEVWRSETVGGGKSHLGDVAASSHLDAAAGTTFYDNTGLASTVYYYWVKACITGGCSDWGAYDTGYHERLPPVPSGLSATDGTLWNAVLVRWTATGGTTDHYEVYRAETRTGAKIYIGTSANASYSDTPPSTAVSYWYFVKACTNKNLCSDYDDGDSGYGDGDPPAAPSWVTASDGTDTGGVFVVWDSPPRTTSFRLYMADAPYDPGAGFVTNSTGSFADHAVTGDNLRYYWVQACNIQGCSGNSVWDSGFAGVPPDAPTGVSASDGTYTDKVHISWNAVADPPGGWMVGYDVYRANSPAGTKSLLRQTDHETLACDDISAVPGQTYTYWIKAQNSHGLSDFSAPDNGYRALSGPTPDASATATATPRATITAGPSPTPTQTRTPKPTFAATDWVFLPLAIKG